jgi:hypothetical protein
MEKEEKKELTIEQSLHNIKVVLDNFVGTKNEHYALELSYNKIVEAIKTLNALSVLNKEKEVCNTN